jgi:outer membrane protein TolC
MNAYKLGFRAVLGALFFISISAHAAPDLTPPADLPPAASVDAVLATHPAILAAQSRLAAATAEGRRLHAGEYEYQARAAYTRRHESGIGSSNEWEIGLERGLRLPAKARLDAEAAATLVEAAEARVADARHEAARELVALWYAALRGAAEAEHWRAQVGLLQQQSEVVAKRLRAGDAAMMESALAKAAVHQAQAEFRRAETLAAAAAAMLSTRFPGLPKPIPQPGSAPALSGSAEEWLSAALADNHELAILRKESERMQILSRRQQADLRPDPTLGLHFSRERSGQDNLIGVSLALPLPGEARRAGVTAANEEANALTQLLTVAKTRIEGEIRATHLNLQGGLSRLSAQEEMVLQLERYAGLAWRAYELGEADLYEALNARKSAHDARRETATSRLDVHESAARLLLDGHQLWMPESGHAAH